MTINKLMSLDVRKYVEKKNGLSYLSWAHAWAEALKADPASTFHVDTFQRADGTTIPYMEMNGGTGMVWVRVTMFGKEISCFLPIMDHRNKPIPNPDSFQTNTAIMRCMTKCLALHGLGLNIYAGEDLPMAEEEEPSANDLVRTIANEAAAIHKAGDFDALVAQGAAFVDAFEAALGASEPAKVEKIKEAVSVSDRANAQLFADGMVQYVLICKSEAGLKSYWKSNQTKIDDLKSNHPDLFTRVRDVFSEMKAKFKENASE
jgi:hypothetical protein